MRIVLVFVFCVAFSASAYAQKITVKNEDGTVTSIDIGPQPELPPIAPPAKSAAPAPAQKAEPKKAATPAKKPAPPKKLAKKPAEKKPAKKTAQKPTKKPEKKQAVVAKPAAKPTPAPKSAPVQAAPSQQQRLGPNMTSDDAIRIAIDAAPPSRSVHAYPVNYKGLHAYQVVFATEEGERFLFVDRETGKLVK